MAWFNLFNRRPPSLESKQDLRLQAWKKRAPVSLEQGFEHTRMIVLDVETSGLSIRRDHLIAIGGVCINNGRLILSESFETILKQSATSSKANILIHGIGKSAQENGQDPVLALLDFLEYIGKDPLIVFHMGFDLPMINNALKKYLGVSLAEHTCFDVAYLAPMFYSRYERTHITLDHWSTLFKIKNMSRHNAAADALATAEIMLKIMRSAPSDIRMRKLKSMQDREVRIHSHPVY